MKKILPIIFAVLLCGCSGSDTNIEQTSADNNNLQAVIGGKDNAVYICNADNLEANYSPIADTKQLLSDDYFIKEIKESFKQNSLEEDTYLFQQRGCYISECGIGMFDVKENNTANTLHCFIFTENLEEVGEILFFYVDGKLDYNLTFRSKSVSGGSDILKILCNDTGKQYIALTTGTEYAFLDSDNKLSGRGSNTIDISGDCWSALNQSELQVSYSDIIDIDNLKWIEFE